MMKRIRLSIQAKINLALLFIFFTVFVMTLSYSTLSSEKLMLQLIEQQTKDAADTYFDGINVLMLSGAMANRERLRAKVLAREGVIEARIIRGPAISSAYGPGLADEAPKDELDQQAMAGEAVLQIQKIDGERVLTVINPMLAKPEYRGVNCLSCHQVAEDTVLGAVRISYSLQEMDRRIENKLMVSAAVQLLIYLIAFVIMNFLIQRIVTRRINRVRQVIYTIEKNNDFSQRLVIDKSHDDID